ncbi:MAG TPA: glycosyltransferase family 4 protein [Rhizomicrobium sp.]|jgi:glycosyltransferase involved in cell wall biosynthesis|nr:glycosyltransferase family 4 protein [Rhizomicrobium sp.]
MTRVLLISSTFPPVTGGSAVVYDNICRAAQPQVVGLAPSCDYQTGLPIEGVEAHDRSAPYVIHRLPLLRPAEGGKSHALADLRLMLRVLKTALGIARREGIRTICLGDLVYGGWLVFPLRYLFGYKVLIYVHGEEVTTRDGGGLFDAWRARFLAHAHAVIAVSSFTRDALMRLMNLDPAKIVLIPNGVDLARFQLRPRNPALAARLGVAGRRVILSVGRLVPRKGADRLIAAMPAILNAVPDAHLLIAGQGMLRTTLDALVREKNLLDRVTFLGEVTDEDLVDLYALADVFALPNREMPDGDTEGFGLVFLEANACGKPVLSGRAGGVVDAVTDGVNGLAVDGNDSEAIAAGLTRLLQDDRLYARLAQGGLETARRGDWKNRAAEFLKACDQAP